MRVPGFWGSQISRQSAHEGGKVVSPRIDRLWGKGWPVCRVVFCSDLLSACLLWLPNSSLTLILLTWTIWRAPTNASKWRLEFNSAFKGLRDGRPGNRCLFSETAGDIVSQSSCGVHPIFYPVGTRVVIWGFRSEEYEKESACILDPLRWDR